MRERDAPEPGRQAERDEGRLPGLTTEERARLQALEGANRELKRANEILRKASAYFAQAELDRRALMEAFIPEHRETYGVEPICLELPIAPSTYHAQKAETADRWRCAPGLHELYERCLQWSADQSHTPSCAATPLDWNGGWL